jgi:hypothetical protein
MDWRDEDEAADYPQLTATWAHVQQLCRCASFEHMGSGNAQLLSRGSAVCTATGYGLEDRRVGVRVPSRVKNFNVSGVHPTSYPMDTSTFLTFVPCGDKLFAG